MFLLLVAISSPFIVCRKLPTGSSPSLDVRQVKHEGHELILQGNIDVAFLKAVQTDLNEPHDSITLVSLASYGGDVDAAKEIR